MKVAQALKYQALILEIFWGDFMITATYLINCMPTRILEGQTPFEMLCGRQTMIDHLRVVGCLCYVATVGLGDKIDPCALPYVFMGYSSLQKGYQVMEISSGCFFASRDVVFHEDVFPFETIVSSSQPIASSSSHELLLSEDDLLRDPQYILMTLGLIGPANPDSLNATSESPTSYEEHHSSYSSMASPSPLAIESFLAIPKETITHSTTSMLWTFYLPFQMDQRLYMFDVGFSKYTLPGVLVWFFGQLSPEHACCIGRISKE